MLDDRADRPVADPFADEITRFGGYRGVFRISGGKRVEQSFRWDDEFVPGKRLPQNNEIVVYEMPVRWMASDPQENPLVELGTLERVIFEQLNNAWDVLRTMTPSEYTEFRSMLGESSGFRTKSWVSTNATVPANSGCLAAAA